VATAVAKRYAKAVFELAQQDGDRDAWERRLTLIRELFADEHVASILRNPTIATEARDRLISDLPGFDREAANLARLLVESDRIDEAGAIGDEFQRLSDEAAGRVRATVTTAVELTAADRDRIRLQLAQQMKKDVRLTAVVDPRILGGLRLQIGDHVIDASVATRLQQLRRRLAAS
jgi:F-type H+-transporting ATPase subunit delta